MGDSSPLMTRPPGAARPAPLRLEAAVLDWAGTVVDFGSFAPTQIFVEAFAEFGVAITLDEARGPMGLGKWDHIRTLCNDGAIAARFALAHARMPTDDDVTAIYNRFMPLQIEKVGAHSALIPGALDAMAALRSEPADRLVLRLPARGDGPCDGAGRRGRLPPRLCGGLR